MSKRIIGNTVGVPNPKTDWNQTDETKSDFLKNKPDLSGFITNEYLKSNVIETKGIKVGTNDHNTIEGYTWNSFGIKTSPRTLGEILNEKLTEAQIKELLAGAVDLGYVNVNQNGRINTPKIYISDGYPSWAGLVEYDENGKETTMEETLATKANEMKLLNKFTFTEAAGFVTFTKTDNGVDYKDLSIRKLIIFTQAEKGETASNTHILFKFPEYNDFYTLTQSIGAAAIATDAARFTILEVDLTKSILCQGGGGCKSGYATTIQYHTSLKGWSSTISDVIKHIEDPIADGIQWASYTNGVLIPAGSKIEIWGCA